MLICMPSTDLREHVRCLAKISGTTEKYCTGNATERCLCVADASLPDGGPFVQLMVRYLHRTSPLADPGCLAAAMQHRPSQWVTDEAVNVVLEQGARSRTAQLKHLAEQVRMPTKQQAHTCTEFGNMLRTAGTAKEVSSQLLSCKTSAAEQEEVCAHMPCIPASESSGSRGMLTRDMRHDVQALAALCGEVHAGDEGRLTWELKSQLDEMACMIRSITAPTG